MENGNYVPQSPARTWAVRYGDCKAKTLLLLAILAGLDVEAEPVLASSQLGDYVPKRLAMPGAFDHVLVRATIGGQSYWLDGTATGARLASIGDTPPFRWVLPVRAAGAVPLALPLRAPSVPTATALVELDQRAGLGMPTLVHAVLTVRGQTAEMVGLAKSQGSKEQQEQMVAGLVSSTIGGRGAVSLSGFTIAYDPAAATATVDARAVSSTLWSRIDRRFRLDLDRSVSALTFAPDRARSAWQPLPANLGAPDKAQLTTRVLLPAGIQGFALEGDRTVAQPLAGTTITRRAAIDGSTITVDDVVAANGGEVAPADIPATRAGLAAAKNRLLRAVAPETVPSRWENVLAGRRDGRFKPVADAYAQAIARDPEEASVYVNRAAFYAGIFDWKAAIPDYDKAVALDPGASTLLARGYAWRVLGDEAKATADYQAALRLDPASLGAINALGEYDIDHGRRAAALARIDEQIAGGGETRSDMLSVKADLLEYAGDKTAALAAMDEAVKIKPGSATLLNGRCWLKAKLQVALDTALKDCTKAIELGDYPAAPLDSRALVYFRLGRLDDALSDVDAALDLSPAQAGSLWLRGMIRSRQGQTAAAGSDFAAARLMSPLIEKEYRRFGVAP